MNVHHLELFYYVARHGGISAAVRHMPYGIQQPAVSGQIRALEEQLETRLFERLPFRLTPSGEKLYAFTRPFFENIEAVATELRAGADAELRIGGSELVLRDHIPKIIQQLQTRHPRIRLSLHAGFQKQVESWLTDGLLDLAITPINARPPAGLRSLRLVCVPIVLLVHRSSPLRHASELWRQKKIADPLIGQPADTSIMQGFHRGLKKLGVVWPQTVEATSVEMVTRYVAHRQGHGVNVAIPEVIRHPEVRALPLDGFLPMTMGAMWRGAPSPLARTVIEAAQQYARATWPKWACADTLV